MRRCLVRHAVTFSADGGAVFTALPVPEPSSGLPMTAGALALGWRVRRRASA
jgi:hypothetical protein